MGKPRKVLFLSTSDEVGGGNRSLLTLATGLRERGVDTAATCPAEGRFPEECARLQVPCRVFDYEIPEWRRPLRVWKRATAWRDLFVELGVDVVHANDPGSARVACVGARMARRPLVCHVRFDMEPDYTRWVFRAFPKPTVFVFNSRAMRDEHAAAFEAHLRGVPREVLWNAVDLDRFTPPSPDSRPASPPRIGILANLQPVKGHLEFLEMAKRLTDERGRAFDFRVLGDEIHGSGYGKVLRERCTELGLDDVVTFAGFQEDVPAALRDLDVLVCASHVEPFGRSLIEAMSCELPVVATRVGGIPEVVEDGVTGYLVAPGSGEELAGAVGKVLDDAELLRRMGSAGRERAHRLFGVDVHVERMLEIYGAL